MTSTSLRPPVAPLPEPKGYPLVGNALDYRLHPLDFYTHCAELGDMVRLRFGKHPVYFVNHPDLIKSVLVTHGACFMGRAAGRESRFFDPLFGHGLAVSEGTFWRRMRRLVQPVFQRQHLAAYGDIAVTLAQAELATWPRAQWLGIRDRTTRLTRKIVAKICFGEAGITHFTSINTVLDAALAEYDHRDRNWLLYLLPEHFPTPSNRRYQQAAKDLDVLLYDLIATQRRTQADDGSMLTQLLQVQDDTGAGMSDREIRDELVNVVIGHDTLSDVLGWAWWQMAQHPEVEAQLVAEWQTVLNGRSPTLADLPQLTYTERVITETLRLYPLAWVTGRVCTQACEIDGHPIHPGENVVMCQWVTHYDPRFFDQPHEFNPDRWAPETAKHLPPYAYYPFGGGARACIGRGLTMMETVLLLAEIGQRFCLHPFPHQTITPHPGPSFSLRPQPALQMELLSR
ncbi:cytochrome P450 [Halomicronema sp. CCY15110]|uniref:cytochrome P450 n=1 Tax=Halomicronema sp. CCY15110 TaxID=2767773 RepID=UPI00194EB7FB|nr:cytochrome P450 [Halomicronema sp. CCY15110]